MTLQRIHDLVARDFFDKSKDEQVEEYKKRMKAHADMNDLVYPTDI